MAGGLYGVISKMSFGITVKERRRPLSLIKAKLKMNRSRPFLSCLLGEVNLGTSASHNNSPMYGVRASAITQRTHPTVPHPTTQYSTTPLPRFEPGDKSPLPSRVRRFGRWSSCARSHRRRSGRTTEWTVSVIIVTAATRKMTIPITPFTLKEEQHGLSETRWSIRLNNRNIRRRPLTTTTMIANDSGHKQMALLLPYRPRKAKPTLERAKTSKNSQRCSRKLTCFFR